MLGNELDIAGNGPSGKGDMPELPEVETMVRGIREDVEGARIKEIVVPPCACRPLLIEPDPVEIDRRSRDKTIVRVTRRAKRVVFLLDSGECFVVEPRMTGLMLLREAPDPEHLRLEWRLEQKGRLHSLWFWDRRGLGTIRMWHPDEADERLGPRFLGPDALEMTLDEWSARITKTERAIKVALLDQKLVAGIGNLYASEILHLARIHPELPGSRLSRRQIAKLHQSVQEVLLTAIQYEGSTLSDGTYRNALNRDGRYQNAHRVYAREGEPCPTCERSTIQRIIQGQRSTFYCARCQRPKTRKTG